MPTPDQAGAQADQPEPEPEPLVQTTTTTTVTEVEPTGQRWLATQRMVVSAALAIGLIGVAIPYGAHTPDDATLSSLSALEWGLSILALLAAITLVIEIARPLHPRLGSGYALAAATGVWFTIAAYFVLLGPTVGWAYAASEAIRAVAWAALALYEWRRVVLARQAPPEASTAVAARMPRHRHARRADGRTP